MIGAGKLGDHVVKAAEWLHDKAGPALSAARERLAMSSNPHAKTIASGLARLGYGTSSGGGAASGGGSASGGGAASGGAKRARTSIEARYA